MVEKARNDLSPSLKKFPGLFIFVTKKLKKQILARTSVEEEWKRKCKSFFRYLLFRIKKKKKNQN